MIISDLQKLLDSKEPLHPDLTPYVVEGLELTMVNHRYFVGMVSHPAFTNMQYLATKAEAERAREAGDWQRYLSIHPRPYRIDALLDAIEDGLDRKPKEYWKAVGGVWTDSENIYQNYRDWFDIWYSDVPNKESAMDAGDRRALRTLPQSIEVWRGSRSITGLKGLSWTTDEDKARWFAGRYSKGRGVVAQGLAEKKNVLAMFNGRNENELVIDPKHVSVRMIHKT